MKRGLIVMTLLVLWTSACLAEPNKRKSEDWRPPFEVDADTLEVLEKINASGAYEAPNLELKEDQNYARTSKDFQPFGQYELRPYKRHFLRQLEYTGPGRAIPEPEHVATVKIGFLGPIVPTVSVATGGKSHEEDMGIKMLQGAQLAIDEANARGGYLRRKIPFELVVNNDNGLWGASGNEITKMVYKDGAWAILGTIDGANSHIAIRVALKAEIFMMNTGDTDPTFVETNIPWVARSIGDDRQMGYLLLDYMYRKLDLKRIAIIRSSNRYGRFGVREVRDGSRRRGHPVVLERPYKLGLDDFSLQLLPVKQANVDAVVHWGDAIDGAKILNQMRALGMDQPFFCCDRCISDRFVEIAGENAQGVVCTSPWDPTRKDPKYQAFCEVFRESYKEKPETYAAHAYDGMNMLIWAVQVAGLNRAKIRDVLAYRTKPWPGVTGDIPLSAVLDDSGEVFLAKREKGRWNYYSRENLDIPRGSIPPRDRATRTSATATSP
jgi:ABC-type branched-subunit amino acid transport system substrate-binding protein